MNAAELKQAMSELHLTVPDSFWGWRQIELIGHILTEPVDNFLQWPEVAGTMFLGDCEASRFEFEALSTAPDWEFWRGLIQESGFGGAQRLSCADYTSGNLVHQAYHLMRWQNATGRAVSDLTSIVEIGGGYGALALLARRAGFTGRYTIIDLPTFSLLQRYYLAYFGLDADWQTAGAGLDADLLVGLWSLSEMNMTDRFNALQDLTARGYLVAACGDLGIPSIEFVTERQPIEQLYPNWYWFA